MLTILLPHHRQLRDAAADIAARDVVAEGRRQAGFLGPFAGAFFAADGRVELVMRRPAEMVAGFVSEREGDPLDAHVPMSAQATVEPHATPLGADIRLGVHQPGFPVDVVVDFGEASAESLEQSLRPGAMASAPRPAKPNLAK